MHSDDLEEIRFLGQTLRHALGSGRRLDGARVSVLVRGQESGERVILRGQAGMVAILLLAAGCPQVKKVPDHATDDAGPSDAGAADAGPSCGHTDESCCTTSPACLPIDVPGTGYAVCWRGTCTTCDTRFPCIAFTCGDGVCSSSVPWGENCSSCPEDCGCADCQVGFCVEPTGWVRDPAGRGLAGAKVMVVGHPVVATTNADGFFDIPVVAGSGPYDLAAAITEVDAGLTTVRAVVVTGQIVSPYETTLTIASAGSGAPPASAALDISLDGGQPLPPRTTRTIPLVYSEERAELSGVAAAEAAAAAAISGPVPAPWTVVERWKGSSVSGWLGILQVGDGGTLAWYGLSFVELESGTEQPVLVGLNALAPASISGTVSFPTGYQPVAVESVCFLKMDSWFGPIQLPDGLPGATGAFSVPAVFLPAFPEGTQQPRFGLCFTAADPATGETSDTCGCYTASENNASLDALAAVELIAPPDGATSFDPSQSELTWATGAWDNFNVELSAATGTTSWFLTIVTKESSIQLPDLSLLGATVPPSSVVSWRVTSGTPVLGPTATISQGFGRPIPGSPATICYGNLDPSKTPATRNGARSRLSSFTMP